MQTTVGIDRAMRANPSLLELCYLERCNGLALGGGPGFPEVNEESYLIGMSVFLP
jgi:hypothetical protein